MNKDEMDDPVIIDHPKFISKKAPQYMAALAATVGAFALGTTIGWSSPGLSSMQNSTHFPDFDKDSEDASWVASVSNLGALIAGLTLGFPLELIGRKWTMLLLSLPYLGGWLLMGFARNVPVMIVGRLITGYCGGAFTLTVPIYVSEIAEDQIRGTLSNIMTILLCSGILFSYCIGALLAWDKLCFVCAAVPVLLFVAMLFAPETPRYLLSKGKASEARQSLKKLRGAEYESEIENELNQINQEIRESQAISVSLKDLLVGSVLKPVSITMTLMFLQQFGGINAVLFFAQNIFSAAKTDLGDDVQSIIIGVVQVLAAIVSTLLIEKAGRKILLTVSDFGMSLSLVVLGTFFYLQEEGKADNLGWLPLVSLVVYIITYNLGFGPLPWTMMGELVPPHIRSLASSIAMAFCWGLAFIITKSFSTMVVTMNNYGCFWLFGACSLAGALFCLLVVPETKGKSLEQIQLMFQKK